MRRVVVVTLCVLGVAPVLPGIAAAFSAPDLQYPCYDPSEYQPPKLLSAQVVPAESAVPWTATYKFGAYGQVSCTHSKSEYAFNLGYSYEISGRFGHGKAEEDIKIWISGPFKGPAGVPDPNGTWTLTTTLACPAGDPWLTGTKCSTVVQTNKLHKLMTINGPFPVTAAAIPAPQRLELLAKSHPPTILTPWEGQSFAIGQPVTVQLKKAPALASQPVLLEFSRVGVGTWALSGAFTKQTNEASLTVSASEFKSAGLWKVAVKYAASTQFADTVERTFMVGVVGFGGSGGLPPIPGSPGQGRGEGGGAQAAQGPQGGEIQARVPESRTVAPTVPARPVPPPVARALRRDPLRLVSSQPSGPAALTVVLQNPAGNEEKPDQTVELRLGGQVVGRARVGRLAAGRDQRLVLSYQLPRGVGGPVGLEVWVGGEKVGDVQVTAGGGRLRRPGQ